MQLQPRVSITKKESLMTMFLMHQQNVYIQLNTFINYYLFLLHVSPLIVPSSGGTFLTCSKLLLNFMITSVCNFCAIQYYNCPSVNTTIILKMTMLVIKYGYM